MSESVTFLGFVNTLRAHATRTQHSVVLHYLPAGKPNTTIEIFQWAYGSDRLMHIWELHTEGSKPAILKCNSFPSNPIFEDIELVYGPDKGDSTSYLLEQWSEVFPSWR